MIRLLALALLIPILSACSMRTALSPLTFRFDLLYSSVDTSFSEAPAEGDESGALVTEFIQSRNYAAFSNQAEAEGSMTYDWDAEGGTLRVGTKDSGIDLSTQGPAIAGIVESLAEGMARGYAAYMSGGASEILP